MPVRKAHIRTVASAKREILALAGFTPVIIQQAVSRLQEALDANKVRFAVSNGKVIDKVEVEDWDNRLRACNLVFSLAGVNRQEDSGGKVGTMNVQVINYGALPADKDKEGKEGNAT